MTKRQILRFALWLLAIVATLLVAFGILAFSFVRKFSPAPPAFAFPAPSNALEAQRQDIDQFSRLLAMDRSFTPAARLEANRQVAQLRSELAPEDEATFRVALMRIAALADNGHTSVFDGHDGVPNSTPLRVVMFSDGLYVLRARSAYADLLGSRVESIEGKPIRDVIATLEQLHGGTEGWRRTRAAMFVESPEILYGAQIGSRPDLSNWSFLLPNGSTVTRSLVAEPTGESPEEMTRWLSPERTTDEPQDWRALAIDDGKLPLSLRDFNTVFRRAWIGQSCTLFIQMKSIADSGTESIADFLDATTNEMKMRSPCNVILDMRFNSGGDYTKIAHFATHLPDFLSANGRIYILTGPQTFSAAITAVAFVKQAAPTRAIIVGEPAGDRLAFFSEGNAGCLPHAPFCFHYTTAMHDYSHPCDDWDKCFWLNWIFPVRVESLTPDEAIDMTYSDYAGGHDPAFERAVSLAAQ